MSRRQHGVNGDTERTVGAVLEAYSFRSEPRQSSGQAGDVAALSETHRWGTKRPRPARGEAATLRSDK